MKKKIAAAFMAATMLQGCVVAIDGKQIIDTGGIGASLGKAWDKTGGRVSFNKNTKIDKASRDYATFALSGLIHNVRGAVGAGRSPETNLNTRKIVRGYIKEINKKYGPEIAGIADQYQDNVFNQNMAKARGFPEDIKERQDQAAKAAIREIAIIRMKSIANGTYEGAKEEIKKQAEGRVMDRIRNNVPFGQRIFGK